MWSLLWEWKFIPGIWVTWSRWPPHPYMVKTLQKILFSRTGGRFPRTWYVASGTPAHHSLFKRWPRSYLALFYGKVKFGNFGFSIGINENHGFLAHLSRRLTRWAYSIPVEPASVRQCVCVCVCVSVCQHFPTWISPQQCAKRNQILTEALFGWGKGCIMFWVRSD